VLASSSQPSRFAASVAALYGWTIERVAVLYNLRTLGMLEWYPAGVQLLSLFQRNPGLIDRIAAVLGAAPSLGNITKPRPDEYAELVDAIPR